MSEPGEPTTEPREDQARWWLEAAADSVEDAIVGKDLQGVIIRWNKPAERIFGYTAEEVIGQSITVIIPPDRLAEEDSILARMRGGETLVQLQTERRHKDGRIIPVSLTITPIRDGTGRIIGISKVGHDLSDMRRLNEELRQREAVLRSILDTIPDALVIIDERGIVQSFSVAAQRLFGYRAEEIVGQNVSMLMPAPYRQAHDGYLARYLRTGERRIIGIVRVVVGERKDGGTFPMELSVGEVDLPGARLFTGFVRDLTARQERERRVTELQAQLVHVSRLNELGLMVSALAHEVNQPLTALINYTSGIRRLLAAGKYGAAQQAMEQVAEQGNRARQIIQGLRELVRKGETAMRLENLAKTIEEASALALVGVGEGLHFELKVDDDAAAAVIDKVPIQQILINLIRNSTEAMAGVSSRSLVVRASRKGEEIEIMVADTGIGLHEEVRAKLFQPFVTTKPHGLGVGLSICRSIAEAHGGRLWAEDRPGGGTVFRFTIPRPASGWQA